MKFIVHAFLLTANICCLDSFAFGQASPTVPAEVEQHIQHVVSGLVGPVVK